MSHQLYIYLKLQSRGYKSSVLSIHCDYNVKSIQISIIIVRKSRPFFKAYLIDIVKEYTTQKNENIPVPTV